MGLKELLLQKGWAGQTLSRDETIERLNPIIRQHMELNHAYNYVIAHCSEKDVTDALSAFQKVARVDVGKFMETVLSCGGRAYNGVDLDPDAVDLGQDDDEMLLQLRDLESAFRDTLSAEKDVEHQMRTRAVLALIDANCQKRLDYLKVNTKRRRRTVPSS